MSEQPEQTNPAGWHPDPAHPGQAHWMEGTGRHEQMPLQAPTPAPGLGRGFARLGMAVRILLGLVGVTAAGSLILQLWGLLVVARELSLGSSTTATTYDTFDGIFTVAWILFLLGAGVAWCVWQYRLAVAAGPGRLRRSPAMHVGSWFIPVVALWFPFQNVRDLWRVNLPNRRAAVLGWWWALWVLGLISDRVLGSMPINSVEDFRAYNLIGAADSLVGIAGAALAAHIVMTLTRGADGRVRSGGSETLSAEAEGRFRAPSAW